jgi:DNA repair exonuclease SbcCD ATPase subunit
MIKLDIGLDKIDRIYHISDIHIRNFKRHDEYRRVFKRIYDYIKQRPINENSVICLTGDIVHSKNDITPELVKEVTLLLQELSDILPTILIPGNHDANLNNNHRLDSLSPIVDAMSHPNLFYLKEGGEYQIANISFVHWSIFEEESSYIQPEEVNSPIKIALYHGAVRDVRDTALPDFLTNALPSDKFKGFDFALLGDLHTFHYLNEEKTVAYPGSLIQQNHGEGLNHGILVWDIPSKTSEFVKIDNDTAFYTLDVDTGLYNPIPNEIPNRLFLRIRYKNTDQSIVNRIISEIKETREIVELTQQKINTFEVGNYRANQRNLVDVHSISQQNQLLSDFLKAKYNLKSNEIEDICKINEQFNLGLKKLEGTRNVFWSPRRFEFSNMFSYGEGNVVDFTNMTGTYGVFAANASGKSSLLAAIEYCIFDKCSKTSKASQVMNTKASDFSCKLEFELNGNVHIIERNAKRGKSDAVKVDVDFYYYTTDGEQVSLNGKERSETNQNIRNLLGTHEDFVLTSMSIQGNNTGFIDMGQTDRKNLLSQFLDISIFEQLYDSVNDKVKESSVLIKEYKKYDYASQLEDANLKIKYYSNEFRNHQDTKEHLDSVNYSLTQKLIELRSSLVQIDASYIDLNALNNLKSSKQIQYESLQKDIKDSLQRTDSLDKSIEHIQGILDGFDLQKIEDSLKELTFHVEKDRTLTIEVEKLKSDMKNKFEKMQKLQELKYDENCAFCMDNVFVKDAIATKESMKGSEEIAKVKLQELREVRAKLEDLKIYKLQKESYNSFKMTQLKNQTDLAKEDSFRSSKLSAIDRCNSEINDIEDRITKYYEKEALIKNNQDIQAQVSEVSKEIAIIKNKIYVVDSEISNCNMNLQLADKTITNIKESVQKLQKLEQEHQYYSYYLNAVGKDGVPYNIISTIIPIIEEDVNNILSQVVDFKVSMKSDGKNINAYIVYEDDRVWPIELASGMEKFVSSLAIRTALVNISSLPRPNFLAIDEGFGVLDLDNMGNVSVLMDYLKTQFKFILMISHIDSIKDVVDSQIEVIKDKKGTSKVQYL